MEPKIQHYSVIFRKEPEGGYTVIVPSLPGCVTYGKDLEEAKKMAVEAINLYLESVKAHNEDIPIETETFYTQINVRPMP